ncbi:Transglutaminase-like enzyme, putative cysteine protease [Singulisphaera sp. GP187]|uniref:transglutaminase-like domain-containing protein n=1 Tax=Singulisphaera sp. GP187 TaxID=1882752 RepID=UPI00092C54B9|nr:transglutaminase family protein [Singulisphaera sp. GP187]SIN94626.1 Transglutaminase-like enzyme, putative cysteine protease [Singulisphaera sp. GP187]
MLIRIGYELVFQLPAACPMILMLGLRPERATSIRRAAGMTMDPVVPIESFTDGFGNLGSRIVAPPGRLVLGDDLIVEDDGSPDRVAPNARQLPVEALPAEVLVYLLGSRYCEVDRLLDTAWKLFASTPAGWGRVQAICDWVHHHVQFGYSYARPTKTAYDVYVERTGVCRDFTHLALTFCRCMNIPARYATGYLGDIGIPAQPCPMDFSGWFEAYLDGQWYTFDARHNIPRIGRVVMARGRDAVDVALTTSFGANTLESFTVWTDEVKEPELSPPAQALIRAAADRIVRI